jgi:hypothetical protein
VSGVFSGLFLANRLVASEQVTIRVPCSKEHTAPQSKEHTAPQGTHPCIPYSVCMTCEHTCADPCAACGTCCACPLDPCASCFLPFSVWLWAVFSSCSHRALICSCPGPGDLRRRERDERAAWGPSPESSLCSCRVHELMSLSTWHTCVFGNKQQAYSVVALGATALSQPSDHSAVIASISISVAD